MLKKLTGLLAIVGLLTFAACGNKNAAANDEAKQELAQEIENSRGSLPIYYPFGKLSAVTYDQEANEVTVRLELDEMLDIQQSLWKSTAKGTTEKMKLMASSKSMSQLIKMLVEADADMKIEVEYTSDGISRTFDTEIPVEDLRQSLQHPLSDEEARQACLDIDMKNLREALPMDVGEGMNWIDIVYHKGDKTVEFVFDTEFNEQNGMAELDDNLFKPACIMLFADPGARIGAQTALTNDLSLRYTIKDTASPKILSAVFSPQELREQLQANYTEEEATFAVFKAGVEQGARDCPITAENGIVVRNIEIDGKDYVITIELPEPQFDVTQLRNTSNRDEQKAELIEGLGEDREQLALLKQFIDRVIYRYIGTPSGEVVDIVIPTSEL